MQKGRPKKYTQLEKDILRCYKKDSIKQPGFINVTRGQFLSWFKKSKYDEGCIYCGLTDEESKIIYNLQKNGYREDATRGDKRMRRLELERKSPKEPYDNLENLAWACHWCNNAKSDFFTEKEFRNSRIPGEIKKALDRIIKTVDNKIN